MGPKRFSLGFPTLNPFLPHCVSTSVRMSAGVEETAEAVPEVGLAVGQVGQVVVAVEAAVALPMTGQRSLCNGHHRSG